MEVRKVVICGIALGISSSVLALGIKRRNVHWKRAGGIICLMAFLGFVAGWLEAAEPQLRDGYLVRPNNGEGDFEMELLLKADGITERDFSVKIPQQRLEESEEQEYLREAIDEIDKTFLGDNLSVNEIRSDVVISDTYQQGRVEADWNFSSYKWIDTEGNLLIENIPEEGVVIQAVVILNCEDSELEYEFYFSVYPPEKSEEEMLLEETIKEIEKSGQEEGEERLRLPEQIGGYHLNWKEKKSNTPEGLLFIGIILVFLMPMVEESRKKEKLKKREEMLLIEYPDMVSKLTLLLGAGMTLLGAWNRIVDRYVESRKDGTIPKNPVYEEMLVTIREIESGIGEAKAYERFGNRCSIQKYRKFGNLLSQNLKKGSQGLLRLMETEARDVFEERKCLARKYGEEAGTKLLLPMLMMFGIVVLLIMIPAVISFQAG